MRDQPVDVSHRILRASVRTVRILLRLQVRLKDRFENQYRRDPLPPASRQFRKKYWALFLCSVSYTVPAATRRIIATT
ncbi:MAG: hypothetical protein OXF98_06330 [Rhodospirillaceae bacterium]|nr:hypothetical protein [Rhodospirillaceae bacterium]